MLRITKLVSQRRCNRVIALFSSINDVTAWPFWKFLQMKKVKGVTDLCILAFNSHGGSFEARIDGQEYTLKNYEGVAGYRQDILERFIHRWHDPGRTYFVYGGHGMGDYLELECDKTGLQCHELAAIFGKRTFEAIVFDACFMASLDCAYHLRHNTRYIGACEGYLWEPDTSLDHHVFNTYTASAMSRFRDPKHILLSVQRDYCNKSPRADFSVLDTTHVEALRHYVEEHVIQRVYDRATFYNNAQRQRLTTMAEKALHNVLQSRSHALKDIRAPPSASRRGVVPPTPTRNRRWERRRQLQRAVQFEHALYPSECEDKYILDLKSYLLDMAREEANTAVQICHPSSAAASPRTAVVEEQGSLPPPTRPARIAKGSAHEGLELFHRVVLSHTQPEDRHLYASHLGGLSLPVHEFGVMSKPLHPWRGVSRAKFLQKAKEYLRHGAVQDVQMSSGIREDVVGGGCTNQQQQQQQQQLDVFSSSTAAPILLGMGAK